jgi:hypothetical protein
MLISKIDSELTALTIVSIFGSMSFAYWVANQRKDRNCRAMLMLTRV